MGIQMTTTAPHYLVRSILGGMVLLFVSACGRPTTESTEQHENRPRIRQTATAANAGQPILIGEYESMTGSQATYGQSTHNGVSLAIEEINAAGGIQGRPLEVKLYDDRGNTQEAGMAVTRLITNDHVTALLGEVASSLSLAAAGVAQQYGIPMISPSSTNPQVTKKGDMIFRVCFIDPYQGYVGAKFLRENLKLGKVAVLYDQTQAYSKGLMQNFAESFRKLGGTIVCEQSYTGGDQDFNAQLTTIREAAPEAIYLPGYYNDVANIVIQARRLGITVPFAGGDGWDSELLTKMGGNAVEGCYYSNHYSQDDPRPEVQDFIKRFSNKYGATPDALAALGYDAAKILADALKRASGLAGKDVAAALAATRDFPGVTGKITIDDERNARKLAVILQIKAGKPTFVSSVSE